jgi:hypothetical protein
MTTQCDRYGAFLECRGRNADKPIVEVYKSWHDLCGHNDLVAEYVGRFGITCACSNVVERQAS